MKRSIHSALLLAALATPALFAATSAFAQEALDPTKLEEAKKENIEAAQEAPASPNTGRLALSGGVDYTTAYFFRGYNQEDAGLILQPYANLYFKVINEETFKLTPYVGIWNSMHDHPTLADPGSSGWWYEADLYAGLDLSAGPVTVGFIYTAYTYPGGAFDTIQELGVKLGFDDTELTKKAGIPFGFKPYVAAYAETNDRNGSEDWYGEVGIAPGIYTINPDGAFPVALTVPVTVGFSLKDYYFDDGGDEEFLGYGTVALTAAVPLPVPTDFGTWSLTGTIQYLHLFAEGLETANQGDQGELIGKAGISFAY